jgi:succinylarginine dihydrolase
MSDTDDDAVELNLDGLVGPTHSYAGLSYGNLASQRNRQAVSNPKEAALQGLAKMKLLADLGVPQAVLPPQERPDVEALRRLGFGGGGGDASDGDVLERAGREEPALLAACCSASGMWAANAATVSPGADTADGRVHFTPANLLTQFHRSLEPQTTTRALRAIFADERCFAHHPPLPASDVFADEGAANHMRLGPGYGRSGIEIFVYGRSALNPAGATGAAAHGGPQRFPARQTREASEAIARLHGLDVARTLVLRQNPAAIDAGAFHNDVVAVGNLDVLLIHEAAFADGPAAIDEIRRAHASRCEAGLTVLQIGGQDDLSLADAVASYLFNSQLVRLPDASTSLIAPVECRDHPRVRPVLDRLVGPERAIRSVHFVDVRQSMRNGGGPACLRLRVPLSRDALGRVHPGVRFDDRLYASLARWVGTHYRDELRPQDLADPRLLLECRDALDALTQLLGIGPIYRFQGAPAGATAPSPPTPP